MKNNDFLEHFKKADKRIYKYMLEVDFNKWFNPRQKLRTENHLLALIREITGQQLSGKAANSIFKRFIEFFGGENGVTPDAIISTRDEELRNVGLSWSKARFIKNLAGKVQNKELLLDELDKLEDNEIAERLTKVKGVGPWTVEMFLIFTLRRENVFSHGDFGLKKGFEKVYKVQNPSREKIESVIKKWEPYKTYGSITLWNVLDG